MAEGRGSCRKKIAPSQIADSKPRDSRATCWRALERYTFAAHAAARQNVFASAISLPLFFFDASIQVRHFFESLFIYKQPAILGMTFYFIPPE